MTTPTSTPEPKIVSIPTDLYFNDFIAHLLYPPGLQPNKKGRYFGDEKGTWYHNTSAVLNWKRKYHHLNDIVRMRDITG
jgi:hypothetical protein